MGNCFVGKPADTKPNNFAKRTRTIDIHDDAIVSALNVESTKKKYDDEFKEEEKINKNMKRNERKNKMKIKKGGEKEPDVLYEHIQKSDKKPTAADQPFIIKSLKGHFVFFNLSDSALETIVSNMFHCEIKADEYMFKQGDNASSYFILDKGRLEVIVNEEPKRKLQRGDAFGELALLYNAPRSASIRALENCSLWGIDRSTFRAVVEEMITMEYGDNRKFIEAVAFFNTMTSEQKDAIASVLITQKFSKGQNIVIEGDPASSFYIIKDGQVQILKGNKELRKMNKGDSFGEQALYYNTVRGATVRALDNNVKCLALGRDTLTRILGDQVQVITFRNQQKWALEKSPIFAQLTKIQIEKIVDAMKIVNYKAGDIVFRKSSACYQKVVLVIEGSLKKAKFGSVVAAKGTPFGDEYLTDTAKTKTYDDDIVMESDGVLSEISNAAFEKAIGGTIEDIIKKNENSHEKRMNNMASELKQVGTKVSLDDLIYYKKLGFGQFGSVYLVKEKNQDQFFALKCVSKQQVVEQNLERHLQQEKSVLEILNFPFIMQFIRTYKDQNFIYFLVEYVKGLELYDVIRIINLLTTPESQFYIGSMILAIEFLHMQGIIYRDLKPENIMIDHTGYMKLIDMGTAKFMKSKGPAANRTFTIIGTPHYMAPEIIAGKGYTLAVDLWSIGICLYEFLCGMVPFGEEAEDPYEIHDEIMNMPIKYPKFLTDIKAKRLMDQLLNKVAEVRLGGSFAALKAHPWFDNFDWDKLLDRQLKPPILPPKEKMITDEEIRKMERQSKKVITVLEEEQKSHKKYKKEQAADTNWDRNF